MDMTFIIEFFQRFQTERVVQHLQDLNVGELIHNPWFLGGTAALALIALFMRWRLLLATILGLTGFVGLLSYTLERGASLEGGLGSETLLTFVGGGVFLVSFIIYFLFIRTE